MRSATAVKSHNKNRFIRIITIPIRALGKAKDFYVRSITGVAHRVSYGSTLGGPVGNITTGLPKNLSTRSTARPGENTDDFAELIRAASARSYGTRIDVDAILKEEMMKRSATTTSLGGERTAAATVGLPKCGSVAMGRIDEDATVEFNEDGEDIKLYPRSRSYAVANRRVF